ncbi:hypothetical protein FSOLCH5_000703 [Fusarium solani]
MEKQHSNNNTTGSPEPKRDTNQRVPTRQEPWPHAGTDPRPVDGSWTFLPSSGIMESWIESLSFKHALVYDFAAADVCNGVRSTGGSCRSPTSTRREISGFTACVLSVLHEKLGLEPQPNPDETNVKGKGNFNTMRRRRPCAPVHIHYCTRLAL